VTDSEATDFIKLASTFDSKPGYKLVDFGEVGLPVYRIYVSALMQIEQSLPPITEFILKAIKGGVTSENDISALLGLSNDVTINCLAALLSNGLIASSVISEHESNLSLSPEGMSALLTCSTHKSKGEKYSFLMDGLTRGARAFAFESLWRPKDLENAGVPAIPFLPSKPPQVEDIKLPELNNYLKNEEIGRGNRKLKILKVLDIERRERLYARSLALAFKPTGHGKPFITFVLDGRISELHEQAFLEKGGLERCEIFSDIKNFAHTLSADVERVKFEFKSVADQGRKKRKPIISKAGILSLSKGDETPSKELSVETDTDKEGGKSSSEPDIEYLHVYDHPEKLRDALENAQQRILIISPWIRRKIVDSNFVVQLREALERKVTVSIGYGLGEDKEAYQRDIEALRDLSFNWLSFLGDRGRTFREEWGVLVRKPDQVDDLYNQLIDRF
jgi:hypothetical protein